MGNTTQVETTKYYEVQRIADVRIEYPLYKTNYSTPEIDHKILTSWCMQDNDNDIENYRYIIPDIIKKRDR